MASTVRTNICNARLSSPSHGLRHLLNHPHVWTVTLQTVPNTCFRRPSPFGRFQTPAFDAQPFGRSQTSAFDALRWLQRHLLSTHLLTFGRSYRQHAYHIAPRYLFLSAKLTPRHSRCDFDFASVVLS
ncbi:uncharacterized protein LACBIDRAFT_304378 [Laccaria bicolor S238N-H82]|uniref:Predicted protein n=1 Tax=Laccaria bicolor (strain S238N-H82 / ATCC MYA-4686) TaxID=486041 RepID=B0DLI1_LACBS|nr:uncharacterized protein LACBIDRAFT_304378 [Laccaria bicolor S238N-H82]EDR04651.1 predicted protein [Laccaria bicolor S238N-H82]|eukprot:XP_001884823.1 predicted protein [Laccaria bicolor S238N-H82]